MNCYLSTALTSLLSPLWHGYIWVKVSFPEVMRFFLVPNSCATGITSGKWDFFFGHLPKHLPKHLPWSFPWFPHGFPMFSPWFPHVFPMVSPCCGWLSSFYSRFRVTATYYSRSWEAILRFFFGLVTYLRSSYWKWPIYSGFTHWKWWFSIVTLVYWVWVNTYRYIFSGMNIHLPASLGFTRYQGFDPSPSEK